MDVRPLGEDFLQAYLDAEYEAVRCNVGGYRIEGMGAQLFEEIEGSHFAMLGLPLLPLARLSARARAAAKLMGVPYAEVIGDPIAHSKSPLIHKFWLEKLGIDGDYRAARVRAGRACRLSGRRAAPIRTGAAATSPCRSSEAAVACVGDPTGRSARGSARSTAIFRVARRAAARRQYRRAAALPRRCGDATGAGAAGSA